MSIGPLEILLLVLVIVLLFGARRLPEIGRTAGQGVRELRKNADKGARELKKGADKGARELRKGVGTLQEKAERHHNRGEDDDEGDPPDRA